MRSNLPITQREFPFPEGVTLVSTTDLDSRITYSNQAFIDISGYSREELVGEPHNLVRHPDMPAEAFRDMWATLQAGKPWRGVVKNRRKDGDHYWVVANVTPVFESGRPVGYMSVRTPPTRTQVEQAEALYARMRDEAAAGRPSLRLDGGAVVRAGTVHALQRSLRPRLTGRFVLAGLATALAVQLPHLLMGAGALADVVGTVAALAATAVAVLWLRQTVVGPLRDAGTVANRIAGCDLTAQLDTDRGDEVGEVLRALSQVSVNLRGVVSDVRTSVQSVDAAADRLAVENQAVASRTESQAASLEQTAASVEQMNAAVQNNAKHAGEANELASGASLVAQRGSEAVGTVVATMEDIADSSRRIGDILRVIDSIAFQTNILALNAAVEAARAGEQGRGFAVVASEVRALAQRSADAARQINGLIADSATRVKQGADSVVVARDRIAEVAQSVTTVCALVGQISTASVEQANGISQINIAVSQLDTATQDNALTVGRTADAARGLQSEAARLKDSVKIFRVTA